MTFLGGVSTLVLTALTSPVLAQAQSTPPQDAASADAVLKGGGSTAAVAAMTSTAGSAGAAQDAQGSSNVKDVIVTGIRGSLQKSLNVKKNSTGVVDAISAEDIGKFPDSNLAQAMERIPGVTVTHGSTSMGGTPTSTGGATQITVRGFGPGFNETLYDGRQVSSAIGNRSFDFSAVGADFVSEIDIMKTPDATLSSGAIGATINIQYGKPFDRPGLRVSGSASGSVNPRDGSPTPNGSVLFSDTFAGDTLGVLVDASYAKLRDTANHVNNQGWIGNVLDPSQYAGTPQPSSIPWIWKSAAQQASAPFGPNWFSQDYGIYQEHSNEERVNARAVLQWRPSGNFLVTLNDNYSRDALRTHTYGVTWWFNGSTGPTNHITNAVTNAHGTVVDFTTAGGYGPGGEPTDFQSQIVGSIIKNNEAGLNAKWNVTDKLKLDFDVDHAESWLNPGGQVNNVDMDVGYGDNLNNTSLGETGLDGSSIPAPNNWGPGGNKGNFLGNGILGSHVVPISTQKNYDQLNQIKLEGDWTQDNLRVKFGVQYLDESEHLEGEGDIFSGASNDWQAYSGYGPVNGNPTGLDLSGVHQSWFNGSFSTANFINGYSGANNLPPRILQFDALQVIHYIASLGNPNLVTIPGFNPGGLASPAFVAHFNGTYRYAPNPASIEAVNERTAAVYANIAYDAQFGDMPVKVNLGLRGERTQAKTSGQSQVPNGPLTHVTGDPTALALALGPISAVSASKNYAYFLPNLDVKLYYKPNLVFRFDASRTETKQPLNALVPDVSFGAPRIGNLPGAGGNPYLLPDISDNIDLGAEWYYQKNSYISVDYFVKQIKNFLKGGTYDATYPGATLPADLGGGLAQFTIASGTNEGTYKVQGVEVANQHVFGETGFGYIVNLTFVKSDHPYNPLDLTGSNVSVAGLADSWNVVGFYDKHGFQARLAVNWRDNVLDRFAQTQNSTTWGVEPTFVKAAYYVDFSTSYQISPRLTAYFEGLNLTDQVYSTYGRFQEQILDLVDTGRRFNFGVRFKL
jgi:TonB-dependent receptor